MKNFDEFSRGIKINESQMRFLNESETELNELGNNIISYLEDNDIQASSDIDEGHLIIRVGSETIEIVKDGDVFTIAHGEPAKIDKAKDENELMDWWGQFVGSHKAGEAEYKLSGK